jgi:hypothetical protein
MKKRENLELNVQKKKESRQGKASLRFKKKIQKDAFKFKSSVHSVLPFCIIPIKTTVMSVKYSETAPQFPFLATVYTEPPLHRELFTILPT